MIDDNIKSGRIQLSEEQIQHLFAFTEKKFVRWYDLQVELVDHLASSVEEEMLADGSLCFEAAVELVYKRFGLFGFAKVVQEKQTLLQRTARNIWWQEIKVFFGWPKIILLGFILAVLWHLPLVVGIAYLTYGFIAVYVAAKVVLQVFAFRYKKAIRKLLLLQHGLVHVSAFTLVYDILVFNALGNSGRIGFCLFAVVGILIQVASFRLYRRIKDEALTLYPHAFV